MIEMFIAGFVLAGSFCVDGSCREVKARHVEGQYSCENTRDRIIERFKQTRSEELGYEPKTQLKIDLSCQPVRGNTL